MFIERENCPSCFGTDFVTIHETPYSDKGLAEYMALYYSYANPTSLANALCGATFTVVKCRDCGLYFQRDVGNDELLADMYGNWLGKKDPVAPHKPPMPLDYYSYMAAEIMQIIAFLQKKIGRDRRLRFLDYGRGWGNWSQMARSFGVDVYGVELSPERLAYAKSIGLKTIETQDIVDYEFDFINTEQVIEHLVDPRAEIEMLKKCLADDGMIKLSVPDGKGVESVLRSWDWKDSFPRRSLVVPFQPLEHLNIFTSDSLLHLANSCGLKRIGLPLSISYAYSTDWSSVRLIAKNILRPIKRFKLMKGCYALFSLKG
jgi:SAM-dependent methyltransferase